MTLLIGNRRNSDGFTLMELILVLGLLAAILAIAAPSLSRFFSGRSLQEETRRFLALTQYGGNQAVNEGVPMVLWIEPKLGEYGLRPETGYPTNRHNAFHYRLRDNLELEVETASLPQADKARAPSIYFLPDGSISETSLSFIRIWDRHEGEVFIAQSDNRLNFEVRDPQLNHAIPSRP